MFIKYKRTDDTQGHQPKSIDYFIEILFKKKKTSLEFIWETLWLNHNQDYKVIELVVI